MFDITSPPAAPAEDDREKAVVEPAALPLDARVEQGPTGPVGSRGWIIRLPVRAERVTVQKRSIVREDARLGVSERSDTVHHEDEVRREVARVKDRSAQRPASRA